MLMRTFAAIIIMIAVIVGIAALVLSRDQLIKIIVFRDFFDIAIPIIAFGALVKYLFSPAPTCKCADKRTQTVN